METVNPINGQNGQNVKNFYGVCVSDSMSQIIVKFKPRTEKVFFYSEIVFIVSKPSRSIQNFNFFIEAWQTRNSFDSVENYCSSLSISCFQIACMGPKLTLYGKTASTL